LDISLIDGQGNSYLHALFSPSWETFYTRDKIENLVERFVAMGVPINHENANGEVLNPLM